VYYLKYEKSLLRLKVDFGGEIKEKTLPAKAARFFMGLVWGWTANQGMILTALHI